MKKENTYDSVESNPLSKPELFHEWRKLRGWIKVGFITIIIAAIAEHVPHARSFP